MSYHKLLKKHFEIFAFLTILLLYPSRFVQSLVRRLSTGLMSRLVINKIPNNFEPSQASESNDRLINAISGFNRMRLSSQKLDLVLFVNENINRI